MYPQRSVMTCGLATALEPPHFNHAPVRGATGASFSRRSRAGSFNPRTRVGCDVSGYVQAVAEIEFQSTHPRGVRPRPLFELLVDELVSIHAPAWGATRDRHPRDHQQPVSIHAPAWGATTALIPALPAFWFQSTHPRGVRQETYDEEDYPRDVSIHAPAWGATFVLSGPRPAWHCFNPRTRVGCDIRPFSSPSRAFLFQSTHPRGVRRHRGPAADHEPGFNPRTRVGCDARVDAHNRAQWEFQSTHPRGVRRKGDGFYLGGFLFQSTHPRGVRRKRRAERAGNEGFQSTHPRGVRPRSIVLNKAFTRVSIHAPAWGATGRDPWA